MPPRRATPPAATTHAVTDLTQMRALADPFRLRLLSVFARGPHTTKQVADVLGEKPTRLYHHVEALARVGLLELKETRPNRGTVERYYQAIATRFTLADSLLFPDAGPADRPAPLAEVVASILDVTRADLERCLPAGKPTRRAKATLPLVARALVTGPPKHMAELQAELAALLEREATASQAVAPGGRPEKVVTYALTIAFYPLPAEDA